MTTANLTRIQLSSVPGGQELRRMYNLLPSSEGKYWIAGGAVRRALKGEPLSGGDIDVFFGKSPRDSKQPDKMANWMAQKYPSEELFVTQYAKTMCLEIGEEKQVFQFIKRKFYTNENYLFWDFDFTVCQFAYDGGDFIVCTLNALVDFRLGILRLSPDGRLTPGNLVRRSMKYIKYGYLPAPNFIPDMIAYVGCGWQLNLETSDHYSWVED